MESRENKIIKGKINSLKHLPEGYSPNLSSKWEIIEAGLPQKNKNSIPILVRWSVAAAMIAALFFTGIKINQYEEARAVHHAVANTPLRNAGLMAERSQQTTVVKTDLPKMDKPQKKLTALPASTIEVVVKNELPPSVNNELKINGMDEKTDSANLLNNESAMAIPQPEIPKRTKRRSFQKDFNDGLLVIDTTYSKPNNQQFSFKLQLHKSAESDNQPSRRLQLKQVL